MAFNPSKPLRTSAKHHILIVDDEATIRNLFSATLRDEKYELHLADNGQAALEIATSIPLDLIFLDIRMPQLDGVEFLDRFNQQCQGKCPIIAITGHADEEIVDQCYAQGVFAIIRKPLHIAEIKAMSRRYTHRHGHYDSDALRLLSTSSLNEEIIESLPVPLFYKDENLIFQFVNRAFEQMSGIPRQDLQGKNIFAITSAQVARKIDKIEKNLLRKGGLHCQPDFLNIPGGEQREVIFYRTTLGNGHSGIMGIIVDVNEFGLTSFRNRLTKHHPHLTQREIQIATLVRLGMPNKEIANQLAVSLSTVEFHRNNLRDKLGLKGNRTNLSSCLLAI